MDIKSTKWDILPETWMASAQMLKRFRSLRIARLRPRNWENSLMTRSLKVFTPLAWKTFTQKLESPRHSRLKGLAQKVLSKKLRKICLKGLWKYGRIRTRSFIPKAWKALSQKGLLWSLEGRSFTMNAQDLAQHAEGSYSKFARNHPSKKIFQVAQLYLTYLSTELWQETN